MNVDELTQIEAAIRRHPAVRDAVVVDTQAGDPRLVAYVVARSVDEGSVLETWRTVWDETYRAGKPSDGDARFDLSGWSSSESGSESGPEIPAAQMKVWVDTTVARIQALSPRRVLELGCGTGLLLFRVAPGCELYVGVDFAAPVLASIESELAKQPMPQVTLKQGSADDLAGFVPGSFDTIIINSVAQYFPDVDYLVRVLTRAMALLVPGGTIFLGDIRSLPLLEAFHSSIELGRAQPALERSELRSRIEKRRVRETELVVDPALFPALASELPELGDVDVLLRSGRELNEMTRFRYDVLLRKRRPGMPPPVEPMTLTTEHVSAEVVRQALADEPAILRVVGVRNSRVARETRLVELLAATGDNPTLARFRDRRKVGELRAALETQAPAFEWEDFASIDPRYEVTATWSAAGTDRFDLILRHRHKPSRLPMDTVTAVKPWSSYANQPMHSTTNVSAAELRAHVRAAVPEAMVPNAFVMLPALPLGPDGSVDRASLPAHPAAPQSPKKIGADSPPAPKPAGKSKISTLTPAQQELLLRRLTSARSTRSEGSGASPPIVRVPRDGELPLSFAEQRLWVIHQLDPDSRAYNTPHAHRLRGPLDIEALRRAFEALVERHEGLRTIFPVANGIPRRHILPPSRFSLPVDDLTSLAPDDREPEARKRTEQAALVRFDLESGPLLHTRVLRLAESDHVLLVTMSHIVNDGWSETVLWRELGVLYGGFSRGESPSLPPLALQYADYAAWLHRWQTGEVLERQLAYWTEQLDDAPADLALPFKGPRPPVQTYRSGRVDIVLDPELCSALNKLAVRHNATRFMVMLAALRTLLARYSGQDDLCIGTPIANRTRREVEGVVGFFVNTLVLRGQVREGDRFVDVLSREIANTLAAYRHHETPFEMIVDSLGIERSLNRRPLIQVMLLDQGDVTGEGELPGLSREPFRIALEPADFDLSVDLHDRAGVHELTVVYNDDLFDRDTVLELLACYLRLLTSIAAQPEQLIGQIELLDPAASTRLTEEWNHTTTEYPSETLPALIDERVEQTPDAIAIVSRTGSLTYRELGNRSNQLARHLLRLGLAPEDRIGICLERGPDLVTAMLGVLKAGAAYLPLDAELPIDRLAYMAADAGVRILLTQRRFADGPLRDLVASKHVSTVIVDFASAPLADESTTSPGVTVSRDQLAYVLYTSGSTGRPKGVHVQHGSLANFLHSMRDAPGITHSDTLLAVTTVSFDISGLELYLPLISGARVFIADREDARDAFRLQALIGDCGATILQATPATWRMLIDAGWEGRPGLTALCGGEALPADLAAALVPRVAALWNLYGPTETTIWSARKRIEAGTPIRLGEPIANTRLYILEPHSLQVQPIGMAGELFIAGAGLARGYGGQPALTAERFLPDPHGAPGDRMYRTGDLVRRGAGGEIEFLGRTDHQIKLRGFRIELGEIEAVLRQHASIRDVVVVARGPGDGARLVAYVVPTETGTTVDALLEHARGRLPEYMVPATVVVLERLPISASGKIDRRALPEPDWSAGVDAYVAPRNDVEQALARVWEQLLHVERVGVHDNFFSLGGSSILGVQLVARIRRDLGVALALAQLFEGPTIAEMAGRLRPPSNDAQPGSVKRLSLSEGPAALLQPLWWTLHEHDPYKDARAPGTWRRRTAVSSVQRLRGALEPRAVERAVAALGVRHEILRTNYRRVDNEIRQFVNPPQPPFLPSYEYEDVAGGDGESERNFVAAADEFVKRPFDLGHGPLARWKLIRLAPEEHVLVMAIHHIIYDAPSGALIESELAAGYRAALEDPSADLSNVAGELPFQFLDVAAYLRARMDLPAGRADLEYWQNRMEGVQPLELPVDFPRAPVDEEIAAQRAATGRPYTAYFQHGYCSRRADETLGDAVVAAARRENVTLLVYCVAGLTELLRNETGQTDIPLHTSLNIRPMVGADQLIGGFNSPIYVRTDVSKVVGRRGLLLHVRNDLAQAYDHALFSPLELTPSAGRVSFGFSGGSSDAFKLGDAVGAPVPSPGMFSAAFDLRASVMLNGRQLTVAFGYNTRLFRQETVERLCERYLAVLEAMVREPDARLS